MAILSKKTEATLLKKGYTTIRVAAERLGRRRPSIDRLVRENKVRSVMVSGIRVIEWNSLLEYVGPDTVALLDLKPFTPEAPMKAVKDTATKDTGSPSTSAPAVPTPSSPLSSTPAVSSPYDPDMPAWMRARR